MVHHKNFFEIQADTYYELGLKEGRMFRKPLVDSIAEARQDPSWEDLISKSRGYLISTIEVFPDYIEELKGYAKGAGVSFGDLWLLSLEDEIRDLDKCTTVITNNGKLIAHNEDWYSNSKDSICVLKKTIKDLTVLELFYYNTLGGNSVSINSSGVVQTINTLTHTDKRVGIPRTVISRWLSETKSPREDFEKLSTLRRSSGYNHNLINIDGKIWNIESSAYEQNLSIVDSPFVHSNHYLTDLKEFEDDRNSYGTLERYKFAKREVRNHLSLAGMKKFMSDSSNGSKVSIFNERTIARMIIDLEQTIAYIWLLREPKKGWIKYDIDFLV